MTRFLLSSSLLFASLCLLACGGRVSSESLGQNKTVDNRILEETPKRSREIIDKTTRMYGQWESQLGLLSYMAAENPSREETFLITDAAGRIVYEREGIRVDRVYTVFAMRDGYAQLVYEYTEGGNDAFVQMLDVAEQKIVERIDSSKGQNSFRASISLQPQSRSSSRPASEPFEILLTDFGLASPASFSTRVLRYNGSKYVTVGEFDLRRAEDCREALMVKPINTSR